jgi:hypothetical protein
VSQALIHIIHFISFSANILGLPVNVLIADRKISEHHGGKRSFYNGAGLSSGQSFGIQSESCLRTMGRAWFDNEAPVL